VSLAGSTTSRFRERVFSSLFAAVRRQCNACRPDDASDLFSDRFADGDAFAVPLDPQPKNSLNPEWAGGHGAVMEQSVTTVVYDTHVAVHRLTDSGVDEKYAEAVVRE